MTALADAKARPGWLYLTLDKLPVGQRKEVRQAVAFWANSLSREPVLVEPRLVGADMVAVNPLDYGWDRRTWDKFATVDPYYSVRVTALWPGGVYSDGRSYAKGSFTLTSSIPAPWLPQAEMAELIHLTGTKAPILRADWWLAQVAVQADRKVGYYDVLGLGKRRADFEALVGMDRAKATRVKKEIAAIVDTSIVALHNRQIYRYATLNGAYWETRDSLKNTEANNAIRLLNGDYKHDAEEVYGSLPNGLFAFFLSDAAGVRADTAPDSIASDGRSVSTDRRVHVGLSCVRCHVEGIRNIDCWARKAYAAPDRLEVADPVRFLRLRQLYLSDLDRVVRRDQADYAAALLATNGLLPADNAKVISGVWQRYVEQPLLLEDVAREMGVKPADLQAALKAKGQREVLDPFLLGVAKGLPMRREHVEESWAVLMGVMQ